MTPHTGPTNRKLRFHLPLVVCAPEDGEARIRVGPATRAVREGEPFAFDDSFQHEAWNDAPAHARIVLILDAWHPDLTDAEVKLLGFVGAAHLRAAKAIAAEGAGGGGRVRESDDFFAVLERAKARPCDDARIFADGGGGGAAVGAPRILAPLANLPVRDD